MARRLWGKMNISKEWRIYGHVKEALERSDVDAALQLIEESRGDTSSIALDVAVLESECYARQGAPDKALDVLEAAIRHSPPNFWAYYSVAKALREGNRNEDCIKAYRRAHALIGWEESERKGYTFLQDYFSPNIPVWTEWFASHITVRPIQALEIGSWQGGSATWLLDKIISRRSGRLTCIDTFEGSSEHAEWIGGIGDTIENIFDMNIAASGHSSLCRKIVGYSQEILRTLYQERFDFIYIDGAHEARYVIEDAVLAFGLLNDGGYICFDDYPFTFPERPRQNTRRAIDTFLDLYDEEISFVEMGRQVLLRKGKHSSASEPVEKASAAI
jgi:predicted O-methyltransferase YrrM